MKNEPIMGKITRNAKVDVLLNILKLARSVFAGSQISDKPLKDISHLMNEPQKFALIKLIE